MGKCERCRIHRGAWMLSLVHPREQLGRTRRLCNHCVQELWLEFLTRAPEGRS
jgi:hypothetical protein